MRNHLVCIVVGILFFAIATPSMAQPTGFAVGRFDAAEVGSDWFSGDSLDFRASPLPAFGLTLDSARAPLTNYDTQGTPAVHIIKRQMKAHLQARYVFQGRFRLAMNLPILLQQSREMALVDGDLYAAAKGIHGGDLRISGDSRLLGNYGEPFSMAAGVEFYLPTGSRAAFVGDGKVRIAPRLAIAGDISLMAYSVRTTFVYRPQHVGFGSIPTGSEFAWVATVGVRLLERRLLIGPELWGSTGLRKASFLRQATTPIELLLGGHYFMGPVRVGLGAGAGLTRGLGSPDYRLLASVAYVNEMSADRDGDGISDLNDDCPYVAGIAANARGENGCPADQDGDGIPDAEDACPSVRGVAGELPETLGCPSDRDGDGIVDEEDACSFEPGVASNDPARNGCKVDRDGDGIQDDIDACPDIAGAANSNAASNGCPLDRDGDGIIDEEDPCPELPGRCE